MWLKMPGRSGVYIALSWRVSVEDTWEDEVEQPTLTLLRITSQAREQHEQRLQGGMMPAHFGAQSKKEDVLGRNKDNPSFFHLLCERARL